MIRIHDTLTRAPAELTTRDPGRISVYVCGPTVYDVPHLGHARTALVFDVLRRYLEWSGLDVRFVANVTDVEDKIIRRAAEEDSSESEVAACYESVYWDEMDRLGVRRPDETPHATDWIGRMIQLVGELVDANAAYAVEGQGVYFDVFRLDDYGALAHRSRDELLAGAGARVEIDELKRSPLDFVLWKAAKEGEPAWESPWGPGRPGWHIECSAMSLGLLGEGFDLHGGGDDLTFPHHENERAQAVAAGHVFARHWMHSGMVVVEGEKMSKSLGNFTTLGEVLDRYDPRTLRLLVLQTHYRKPMEMGARELDAAAVALERLDAVLRRGVTDSVDWSRADPERSVLEEFSRAMDDDLDTPSAVGLLFEQRNRANLAIDAGDGAEAAEAIATMLAIAEALGLTVGADEGPRADDDEIRRLVEQRDEARVRRDFGVADRLRDELAARGVTLEDTPSGTIWHR